MDLAETRLKGTGIRCFVTGGNDDDPEVLEAIQGAGRESFFACEGQVVPIDDFHTHGQRGLQQSHALEDPTGDSRRETGRDHRRHVRAGEGFLALHLQFPRAAARFHAGFLPEAGLEHGSADARS